MCSLSYLSTLEEVIRCSDRDLRAGIGYLSPDTVTGTVIDPALWDPGLHRLGCGDSKSAPSVLFLINPWYYPETSKKGFVANACSRYSGYSNV